SAVLPGAIHQPALLGLFKRAPRNSAGVVAATTFSAPCGSARALAHHADAWRRIAGRRWNLACAGFYCAPLFSRNLSSRLFSRPGIVLVARPLRTCPRHDESLRAPLQLSLFQ